MRRLILVTVLVTVLLVAFAGSAVETLNAGAPDSLTELAHRLGYFDQAAFNHAFEKLTGKAPGAFRTG